MLLEKKSKYIRGNIPIVFRINNIINQTLSLRWAALHKANPLKTRSIAIAANKATNKPGVNDIVLMLICYHTV